MVQADMNEKIDEIKMRYPKKFASEERKIRHLSRERKGSILSIWKPIEPQKLDWRSF